MMLGYIHNGWMRAEFMASVLQLQISPVFKRFGRVSAQSGGTLVSFARNKLAEAFLDSPSQWLFMVDTDMAFSPVQVEHLALSAHPVLRPVVSGVCATLNNAVTEAVPNVYDARRDETGAVLDFAPKRDCPAAGLIKVDGCAAAFVLIHRGVLEKIPAGEWFRESVTPSGGIRGEDLSFSLRVTEAGFPIYAHCGVRPGHMKTICITVDP